MRRSIPRRRADTGKQVRAFDAVIENIVQNQGKRRIQFVKSLSWQGIDRSIIDRIYARGEHWTVKGMTAGREPRLCYLALWACLLLY